jgi:signal transduction histidine kinase
LVDEQAPQNILSDFARVRQVFVNLIQNAIKFTDHGSVKVTVFSLPAGDQWGFTVADTGDGIPTSRLPDIFEPFRRGSDYAVRTRQGAGLGLSISKQLVELMGGKIEVRSEVGRGTTFTVTLPQKINQNGDVSHE